MSRARSLKPGFFRNPELSEMSPLTRIFFQGLWCEADRRGIVEDRPKKLKADILPYDKANPEEMLKNLESKGFIQRYEVDGVRCIFIVKFSAHQNPHRDEKENALPAPCEHSVSTVQEQGKTGTNRALTLNPITDSLNLEPIDPPNPLSGESPKAQRKHRLPESWEPGNRQIEALLANGFSASEIDAEAVKFRNYHLNKGDTGLAWDRAFANWMQNAREFAKTRPPNGNGHAERLPKDLEDRRERWLAESREYGEVRPLPDKLVRDIEAWKSAQKLTAIT